MRHHYRRMSAAELSAALDQLDLSARQFARVSGAQPKRVIDWLEGREDIAPYVPVMLALMTLPGGIALARACAETYIDDSS